MQRLWKSPHATGWLLASPLTRVFLALPIVMIVTVSFWQATGQAIILAFSLENYEFLFGSPVICSVFPNTFKYTAITWAVTLAPGFAIAYFLAFHLQSQIWQTVLFPLCPLPFRSPNISRIPFLGRNGIANSALMDRGMTKTPLEWLPFSDFAVTLAFLHLIRCSWRCRSATP